MAKTKSTNSFDDLIQLYINDMKRYRYLEGGSLNDYPSRLKAVDTWNDRNSLKWIEDSMKNNNVAPITDVENLYEDCIKRNGNTFGGSRKVTNNHKSNYLSFAKWMIGQYHANMWLSMDKSLDLEYCILIAKHALFCSIDIATEVKNGTKGGQTNTIGTNKGNKYFSWFRDRCRRKDGDPLKCRPYPQKENNVDMWGDNNDHEIFADDNTYANNAIKNAVKASLPWKGKNSVFKDYEACHIWDGTCYDYRYHTSVFNLVLVPRAIAGLTDHNKAVKEMLQYEAARRFGVYPRISGAAPKKPENYNKITIWRQQDEHNNAPHNKFKAI